MAGDWLHSIWNFDLAISRKKSGESAVYVREGVEKVGDQVQF